MARLSTVFPQQLHDMALERGIKSHTKSSEGNTPAQPENQWTNILITWPNLNSGVLVCYYIIALPDYNPANS
jgi:hypothetical protein